MDVGWEVGVVRGDVDAAAVAERVGASPSVAGLHPGRDGRIVTRTAVGPVVGVRVDPATLVIGVVGRAGENSVQVVDAVRTAVGSRTGLSISVSVEARLDP